MYVWKWFETNGKYAKDKLETKKSSDLYLTFENMKLLFCKVSVEKRKCYQFSLMFHVIC